MVRSCILLLLGLSAAAEAAQLTRGPYLQLATYERMVVRWRTDAPDQSYAELASSPQGPWEPHQIAGARTEHELPFESLQAATRYFYRVAGTSEIYSFRTSPPPGQSQQQRFWVLGDVGSGWPEELQVRDAFYIWNGTTAADHVILLGDNAYDSGLDEEFQTGLFEPHAQSLYGSPVWPTFGNHDGVAADGLAGTGPYFDAFSLPAAGECGGMPSGTEAYYAFDVGDVHLIVLDSHANPKQPNSPMTQWLAADLALPQVQAASWRIAFFHHPPYSKGSHDSDSEWGMVQMRENILPVLEAGGVDLVLTGHSHAYERSMLLDGHYGLSTTLDASMLVDDGDGSDSGDGAYRKSWASSPHSGTVYVVAGSSGKLSQAGALDHPVMASSLRSLGSLVIDVDGPRLDLGFLDANAVIRDGFTMLRVAPTGSPAATSGPRLATTSDRLQLHWSSSRSDRVQWSIFDLRGRLVRSPEDWQLLPGENVRDLPLSGLAAGSYLLRLRSQSECFVRRFVNLP